MAGASSSERDRREETLFMTGFDAPVLHTLYSYTQSVLDQAKAPYRYWPEVEDRLFE